MESSFTLMGKAFILANETIKKLSLSSTMLACVAEEEPVGVAAREVISVYKQAVHKIVDDYATDCQKLMDRIKEQEGK